MQSDRMRFTDRTSPSVQLSSLPYQCTPTPFTPPRHSPFTPRREHASLAHLFTPPSPPESPPSMLKFAEIKRKHKPNPILMSKEDVREKRRNIFLKKLMDAREQSRIQARGGEDEMMRMILVSEQRRWQASLARTAAKIPTIEEETELQLLREAEDLQKLDELIDEQDRELEAILSQLNISEEPVDTSHNDEICPHSKQTKSSIVCESCGELESFVQVGDESVCFCCGWSSR